MNLGPREIVILLIVVLVLFGAKRLPDSARSLGRSMRIFKSEMKEMKNDDAVIEEDGKTEK
jgi:TatA/E family protein of Tat protein translocase